MKKTFNEKLHYVFVLTIILLTACNGMDKDETPEPESQPACKLLSIMWPDQNLSYDYEYNSSGYLSKETRINTAGSSKVLIRTMTYDAQNKLIRMDQVLDGINDGYTTYKYGNGVLTETSYYDASESLKYSDTYTYGPDKTITKITSSNGEYSITNYDTKGNLLGAEKYTKEGKLVYKVIHDKYDDKHHYTSAIKGYYLNLAGGTPNNPLSDTFVDYSGTQPSTDRIEYTYNYNSDGFPIEKIVNNSSNVTYTYECD